MRTSKLSLLLFGAVVVAAALPRAASAAVVGESVSYSADGTEMKGYLAYDKAKSGKRPAVLVVHEWWGLNDYARRRARMLADLGYTALAIDMYGKGQEASHPEEAGKFSQAVLSNLPRAEKRFLAALQLLKEHPTVDTQRIAAIGYCFGGGVVLHMARVGTDLDGVASFHGSLAALKPARKGAVKAKVLVMNGADDPFVKQEEIQKFEVEMKQAGADYKVINYPGAKHSFTNPDADAYGKKFKLPLEYSEKADRASWNDLEAFLQRAFAQK